MELGMNNSYVLKNILSYDLYMSYVLHDMPYSMVDNTTKTTQDEEEDSLNRKAYTDYVMGMSMLASEILKRTLIYAPVDTGKMRDSVYIRSLSGGITIGYSVDYAIYPHEIGFYSHKGLTRYKFLEDAAYEVANEMNTNYVITITYSPLAIYINVPDIGSKIIDIKERQESNLKQVEIDKALSNFYNFNKSEASQEDILHHDKMQKFFDFWRSRNVSDTPIIEEWQDRQRHD